ncbi:hypothetical protein DFQ28_002152 [Apophysomyces sp. BC1034]|nr:hypothetical protein DFQ30_007609 [Apophysomyces sp. BC1015]KAG0179801.1 hypothetical protein DFQ29_001648 [Apophysomyces sp. BC1021]KAG0190373.1 hypothetical protein DFQ28_002152 [Apophysomyces sp. BC1034]
MTDAKSEVPAVSLVGDEHPLTDERLTPSISIATDPLEADETTRNVWDDDQEERHSPNHPLEAATLSVSEDNGEWEQQQERTLLDEEGRPNVSRTPSALSLQDTKLDSDTSHVKGFQNAGDLSEIADLVVQGELPSWLTGEHFTIGPGTYDVKYTRKVEIDGLLQSASSLFTFGHWFDALPLVNRFDLNGQRNTITYRNRLTCRRLIEKVRDHHGYAPKHPAGLFKTNSNQTVLVKFIKSAPKASKPDAEPCGARILPSIPGVDGRLFCQNMANHIQELDPFDLKPTRVLCWNEVNPAFKGYNSCPNGQFDVETGEYINFTMEIGYRTTAYHFFSTSDRNPKGSVIGSVTAPTGYVNSFALTRKYIILGIFPLLANSGAVKFAWNESIMDSFTFYPNEPTLFYVVSRANGQHVATYRSDPCFAFHHINAFDDERDNIFVDIVCYPDATIAHQLTTQNLRNPSTMEPRRLACSEVRRYKLGRVDEAKSIFSANNTVMPSTTSVTSKVSSVWGYLRGSSATDEEQRVGAIGTGWHSWMPVASFEKRVEPSLELPQVNPNYKMQKYTYMYGLGFSATSAITDGRIWDSIVKADLDTKSIVASWHEDHCYPSEAVFIPRPGAIREDEGVLISVVLDSARATSFLLVLDAATLQVAARAELNTLIPLSFAHGSYKLRN